MRNIAHHAHEQNFNESIHGLVKNSPWWMTSLIVHLIAVFVFWNIAVDARVEANSSPIRSSITHKPDKPEELITPIKPPTLDTTDVPIEPVEDQPPMDDTNKPFKETANELDGESRGPFEGAGPSTAIGPGGPPGGSPHGRGGDRRRPPGGDGAGITDNAVEWGLRWLADHQDDNGGWDCDEYMKHDPADDRCDGSGGALYDVGVTGLSLLAFLGAGYTDRGSQRENKYAKTVRSGLRYLLRSQDEQGVFGTRAAHNYIYNHAIATLAMCEAYWLTRNPRLKKSAQDGLNYLSAARNPYLAWRYHARGGTNDTSVTAWAVMALKSGKFAGLEVDPDAFKGARLWIDKMTEPNFGKVGYNYPGGTSARPEGMQDRFPADKTEAMTAAGMLTRIFLGEDPRTSKPIKQGAKLCVESPPTWDPEDGSIDMYYWYYATLAMYQVGGADWAKWNRAMVKSIVGNQQMANGSRKGSWDPIGAWGSDGGRVYSTACMTMCLEVYYRYDRVFGTK